jgi:hypothetical protein
MEGLVYLLLGVNVLFLICMIQQESKNRSLLRKINKLEMEKEGFEIIEPTETKPIELFDEEAFKEEYDEIFYEGKHCS